MKGWNTIGEFSAKSGLSAKALRHYEKLGMLTPQTRGDNSYRYYHDDQLELAKRLTEFKQLGFSLVEIKGLLSADQDIDSGKIVAAMKQRLQFIVVQSDQLTQQREQIQNILASFDKKTKPLKAHQRRAIMSFYGKVSIVVTGKQGLEKTAGYIQRHFQSANQEIPIVTWTGIKSLPAVKPYILIVKESDLSGEDISLLQPDVVVIKSLGEHSTETQHNYLKLYSGVGPHVNTIVNADDRSAVDLAGQSLLKKGRIFYFSKNKGLVEQIQRIGGVVSDGEEVEVYGFNLKPETVSFKLARVMTYEDELALLSSIGAVMTVGLEASQLQASSLS